MESAVSWVPKKPLNRELIENCLQICEQTNQFTNGGPNVKALEAMIHKEFDIDETKCIICVCNGSSAIQMLCAGIEYTTRKSIKWATQSFTFPPSAQSILGETIIVDIDEKGGIDLRKVPPKIEGIVVTNVFGNVVDIDKYEEWAKEKSKFLVFDNAATPCTSYKGKNACNYGQGSIISFHHTKPLGFGEGGAIIVDRAYERAIRRLINFGLDNECPEIQWHRKASNHKMSDIAAIYILQHISHMDTIIAHHKYLYSYLEEKIRDIEGVRLYPSMGDKVPFVSCFCLLFSNYKDEMYHHLISTGFYCRKYYKPLIPTPKATEIYNKILCIPCTCEITINQLNFFLDVVQKYL